MQISDHFEFWIGKWKGYNKSTNELLVTSESKWKDKGKSLETDVIVFKDGEQQDVGIGSNYYDEKIGVFVFKLVLEKTGNYYKSHNFKFRKTVSYMVFPWNLYLLRH